MFSLSRPPSLSAGLSLPHVIMDGGDVTGGDQPPRVEITLPLVPPESGALVGEVPETLGFSISAALAEEAVTEEWSVMTGLRRFRGAMAPRIEEEAVGRSEVVGDLEERATEA